MAPRFSTRRCHRPTCGPGRPRRRHHYHYHTVGTQLHTFAIRGTQTRSGADDTRFTGLATCVANRTMRRCPFTRISHLRG